MLHQCRLQRLVHDPVRHGRAGGGARGLQRSELRRCGPPGAPESDDGPLGPRLSHGGRGGRPHWGRARARLQPWLCQLLPADGLGSVVPGHRRGRSERRQRPGLPALAAQSLQVHDDTALLQQLAGVLLLLHVVVIEGVHLPRRLGRTGGPWEPEPERCRDTGAGWRSGLGRAAGSTGSERGGSPRRVRTGGPGVLHLAVRTGAVVLRLCVSNHQQPGRKRPIYPRRRLPKHQLDGAGRSGLCAARARAFRGRWLRRHGPGPDLRLRG